MNCLALSPFTQEPRPHGFVSEITHRPPIWLTGVIQEVATVSTSLTIRTRVLATHGVLALCLGLALLYVGANMDSGYFEVPDVALAIGLSAGALILAALSDWFAAFRAGLKHFHQLKFYLLGGAAFALAGVTLILYTKVTLEWLVLLASFHALASGVFGIVFAWKAKHHKQERLILYLFSGLSVLFAVAMAALIEYQHDRSATLTLGAYMCFVGVKMFFFSRHFHRLRTADKLDSGEAHASA